MASRSTRRCTYFKLSTAVVLICNYFNSYLKNIFVSFYVLNFLITAVFFDLSAAQSDPITAISEMVIEPMFSNLPFECQQITVISSLFIYNPNPKLYSLLKYYHKIASAHGLMSTLIVRRKF